MNPYTLDEFLKLNPLVYREFKEDTCRVYMRQGDVWRVTLFKLSDYNVTEATTQFVFLTKKS